MCGKEHLGMPTPSVQLRFDLDEALRLAVDAATATEHRTRWEPGPTLDHPGYDVDAGPCLMLVRDDGVYLMSTNENAPKDAEDHVPVCYASGFDPRSGDWRSTWDSTGLPGDDFAEYLEVDSGLLEDLRAAIEHGYRWFVVDLTDQRLSLSFDRAADQAEVER
jgi:hypothetical protein